MVHASLRRVRFALLSRSLDRLTLRLGRGAVVEPTDGDRVQWSRAAFGGLRAVVLRLGRRDGFRRFVVAEDAACG